MCIPRTVPGLSLMGRVKNGRSVAYTQAAYTFISDHRGLRYCATRERPPAQRGNPVCIDSTPAFHVYQPKYIFATFYLFHRLEKLRIWISSSRDVEGHQVWCLGKAWFQEVATRRENSWPGAVPTYVVGTFIYSRKGKIDMLYTTYYSRLQLVWWVGQDRIHNIYYSLRIGYILNMLSINTWHYHCQLIHKVDTF